MSIIQIIQTKRNVVYKCRHSINLYSKSCNIDKQCIQRIKAKKIKLGENANKMLIGNSYKQLNFLRKYCAQKDHPGLLFITVYLIIFLDDECRDIIFKEPIANKARQ